MSNWYKLVDGEPVLRDPGEPGEWLQHVDVRRVGYTELPGDIAVSTVFLGLDHGWGDSSPVLWETLVSGGPLDQEMERYTSRADAEAGHEAMIVRIRVALRDAAGGC